MKTYIPSSLLLILGFLLSGNHSVEASIVCPHDITINCAMNYTNTQMTGVGIVSGHNSVARYTDQTQLNACGIGSVRRTWYEDTNYNYIQDSYEASCVQWITIVDIPASTNVVFPEDRTYSCVEDIEDERPYYWGGPCDSFGVSVDDQVFTIDNDACYKILRRFTVINWCDYHPTDPDWNGEGIWEGVQKIKVIDNEAPRLQEEDDVVVGVGNNCRANGVVLTNSAIDNGDCPSSTLSYELYIDLDWDGVAETRYSYLEDNNRYIAPAPNGDTVEVTLVESLKIGTYKFKWVVKDGCGNIRTEHSRLIVQDLKPPTPYCISFLHATLNGEHGGSISVSPRMFNRGSWDNCSHPEQIKLSFSPDVNDTIRTVTCDNQGIQFYRIYATDYFGNQDYCEVFLLAFDNGSCNFNFHPVAQLSLADNSPFSGIQVEIRDIESNLVSQGVSNEEGQAILPNVPLVEDFKVRTNTPLDFSNEINVLDLIVLYRHLLGYERMEDFNQRMLGDINGDQRISPSDLALLRDILLERTAMPEHLGHLQFLNTDYLDKDRSFENVRDFYHLYNYKGSYDFMAYVPGDLDQSHIQAVNPDLEGRALKTKWVDVKVIDGASYLSFREDTDLEAVEFNMGASFAVESSIFELDYNSLHQSAEKTKLIIIENEKQLDKDEVWLKINAEVSIDQLSGLMVSGVDREVMKLRFQELNKDSSKPIAVFPNPVYDRLQFSAPIHCTVFDMSGRLVLSAVNSVSDLDVSELEKGMYLIQVVNEAGEQSVRKIVKL